ncbi:TPA: hypothetical protein HA253_03235 [Candidatus Woesearchaeota archaeon]|nr:hypothetical protein [Candidatus Woesearchaeota archaeon]
MKDHIVLVIIIFLFMTTVAMIQSKNIQQGEEREQPLTAITGNAVGAGEKIEQDTPPPTKTKSPPPAKLSTNLSKTKPRIQPACDTTCTPAGITCAEDALRICQDTDGDGCFDLTTIACIYGCDEQQQTCKSKGEGEIKESISKEERTFERKRLAIAQSDLLRQPIAKLETQENCGGALQGIIEWNPDQSVCRKDSVNTPISGYTTLLNCCKRFFYQSSCTKSFGMKQRGLVLSSQFFTVGCYDS